MKKPSVLLIEDEVDLARITANTLRNENFSVTVAENGTIGLELACSENFDVCVLDVMLPGIDGYSLARELRSKSLNLPIIFLTARTLKEDVLEGYKSGGNDYMRKPFSIEELIVRINEILRRRSYTETKNSDAIQTVGNYSFNSRKMELKHHLLVIQLTNRENEILKRLVSNVNQIVAIDELVFELWDNNDFYSVRSLNVFITKIRKHLSLDPAIKLVNIRAVGYKLIID